MTRQPGHLNGSKNKNFRGSNENWRTGSTCVGFSTYTLTEAKIIAKEAHKKNIKNRLYLGSDGTEESFKKLSNSDIDLIHLSTHGLCINEENISEYARKNNYAFLLQQDEDIYSQSLNSSFLIMSGGNRLSHRDSIPEGKEDGILTAKEVSIMNLQNVKLLVLSACQSGLGKLSTEGVMGLQLGFKKAGVGTIVMTLDNIDDKATQLFMERFYKNLFSGKSKLQSLKDAQKHLRHVENGKYNNPKYWASFIMLDGLN